MFYLGHYSHTGHIEFIHRNAFKFCRFMFKQRISFKCLRTKLFGLRLIWFITIHVHWDRKIFQPEGHNSSWGWATAFWVVWVGRSQKQNWAEQWMQFLFFCIVATQVWGFCTYSLPSLPRSRLPYFRFPSMQELCIITGKYPLQPDKSGDCGTGLVRDLGSVPRLDRKAWKTAFGLQGASGPQSPCFANNERTDPCPKWFTV